MRKSFIISSLTALAAFCLCVTAQAQGPVVVSDKDDYSPGETAMFSATGFQPNELLDFSIAISDENGNWLPDIAWADVPADASGGAEVDYIVPETWADKTLQLTVMGLSSGLMATTTFTDSVTSVTVTHVNGMAVASLPLTITSLPATLTVKFDYVTSASGTTTADLDLLTTPTAISNTGVSIPAGAHTGQTISLTIPSGTTNQTANVKVTVYNSTGSGANQKNDVVNMAVTIAVPAGPTPTPPVITCASPAPTPDLGQAVGCLGDSGFSREFPVTYSVADVPMSNSKVVQATFTTPNGDVGPVTVATVTDANATDTITVTLNGMTPPVMDSVTISGPGSGSANFSVNIQADDGIYMVSDTCGGNANAQITYAFSGFFPPLNGQVNTKVKRGSGVPVKFQISDCSGTLITPNNLPGDNPTIDVAFLSGAVPAGDPTVDDAGMSGDNGDMFRWDAVGMQWIFNLKTNNTYVVGDSYQIEADLGDGTTQTVAIAIK